MRKAGTEPNGPSARWCLGAVAALAIGIVLMAVLPAGAEREEDDEESPVTEVHASLPDGVDLSEGFDLNDVIDQLPTTEDGVPQCNIVHDDCRIRITDENGVVIFSCTLSNCPGSGGTTSTTPTTPPPTPSVPTLATPTLTHVCTSTGWETTWTAWASSPALEYEAAWEAQWRRASDPAGMWQPAAVVAAGDGNSLSVSGVPQPDQTVEVQVRGQARRRAGNAIGWSDWSGWSAWSAWRTDTSDCPPPGLPTPTVTACRSAAGIEVEWTVPPGTWRDGNGWLMDVLVVDSTGSPTAALPAFSRDNRNPLLWADRSVTLAIPVGDRIHVGLLAYDGSYGILSSDIAEATPQLGCGPTPPPAAPDTLADPSLRLSCGEAMFAGAIRDWAQNAPANWERESEYEAEYRDTASEWQTLTLSVNAWGDHEFSGPPDPGNQTEIRVRARGRHRHQVNGEWSAWSAWNAWSPHYIHRSALACPLPPPPAPPPPTASAPTNAAVDCTAAAGIFTAEASWDAPSNTTTMQYRHTVSWTVNDSGTTTTYTTGPHTARTATISSTSRTIGENDITSVSITTEARARTLAGGRYSLWSAWGTASAAATATDSAGCPTGSNLQSCTDPTHIPAYYPPAHVNAGQFTGVCYPPGHQCLPPPHGTGAADVLCLPRGS